jgi:molybdopterin-guanine dinucleotide biosynthesis protein A
MTSDVAVVVLAGGEGQRIGGGKPLKRFRGERLVDQALRRAQQWSDVIAIAVRDAVQVGPLNAPLIKDEDVPGPLGGLISGLRFALEKGRHFLLAIPADMPFLPHDLVERLRERIGDNGCAMAESGGHIHPVCSLWRASVIADAQDYAESGRRSLKGLAGSVGFAVVEWPVDPVDPFFNINTSADLAEAARRIG